MNRTKILGCIISAVVGFSASWTTKAEKPQDVWKAGLSYTFDIEKHKDPADSEDPDKTLLISLNGGYRHNFSEFVFAEGNAGLFYQGFPNARKDVPVGGAYADPKVYAWGLGLEPEALIGIKLINKILEISTGPSVQYLFVFHRNSWYDCKNRFFALWNFRAGTTVGRFNPYAEFQLPLSDFSKHGPNDNMNYYLRFGLNYCF